MSLSTSCWVGRAGGGACCCGWDWTGNLRSRVLLWNTGTSTQRRQRTSKIWSISISDDLVCLYYKPLIMEVNQYLLYSTVNKNPSLFTLHALHYCPPFHASVTFMLIVEPQTCNVHYFLLSIPQCNMSHFIDGKITDSTPVTDDTRWWLVISVQNSQFTAHHTVNYWASVIQEVVSEQGSELLHGHDYPQWPPDSANRRPQKVKCHGCITSIITTECNPCHD